MDSEVPYDAFVTLFVFLIGVPAVVLQTLPPETRQHVWKRPGELLLDTVIPFAMVLAVLASGIAVSRAGLVSPVVAWTAVLGASLLIGVFAAVRVARKYSRRDSVIRRLQRQAERDLERTGRLGEEHLHDLVEFGKLTDSERARQWVLQSLLALTERICADPRYAGDGLEDLISGMLEILLTGSTPPYPQNVATATTLLRRTLRALDRAASDADKHADVLHAMYAAGRLGKVALELRNDASALSLVQALGITAHRHPETCVAASQVLFELGVAALEGQRTLVGVAAAGHLTNLVERNAPATGELVVDTIGLLSHFWSDSETAREFARENLRALRGHLKDELTLALERTSESWALRTWFGTADRVRVVLREMGAEGEGAALAPRVSGEG
jgi:prepilin signal peptidase PulO-like enzyme (type II secretory pathway)